jgi:hypothetical protein
MFSNVDCDSSADVYAEMMAGVKFANEERRYCSTRAVSSWSLHNISIPITTVNHSGRYVPYEYSIQGCNRPVAVIQQRHVKGKTLRVP